MMCNNPTYNNNETISFPMSVYDILICIWMFLNLDMLYNSDQNSNS
jgi:hypothetical protein